MRLAVESQGRRVEVGELPFGDDGVAATVAAMQAVVDHAVSVSALSLRSIVDTLRGDVGAEAMKFGDRLFDWMRQHVQFQRDPSGIELLRHPADLLAAIEASGSVSCDCDDLACLGCAILHVAGLRPVLVTVGRVDGGRFEHVFCAVRLGSRLSRDACYALDPQESDAPGRWPMHRRAKLWGLRVTEVVDVST